MIERTSGSTTSRGLPGVSKGFLLSRIEIDSWGGSGPSVFGEELCQPLRYRFVSTDYQQYPVLVLIYPSQDEALLLRVPDVKVRGRSHKYQPQ